MEILLHLMNLLTCIQSSRASALASWRFARKSKHSLIVWLPHRKHPRLPGRRLPNHQLLGPLPQQLRICIIPEPRHADYRGLHFVHVFYKKLSASHTVLTVRSQGIFLG